MTLLAAIKSDDAIWIGADGRHVATFGEERWGTPDSWAAPTQKLFPFMDRLVWGWYGDAGDAGLQFERYMETASFPDWPSLQLAVDIERRRFQGTATLGVLIAGYIGDTGLVLHLGNALHAIVTGDLTCCAYCKMAATVGWESASAIDTSGDLEHRFDAVMEAVIRVSNHVLDEPRSVWRITPDERVQIRGQA